MKNKLLFLFFLLLIITLTACTQKEEQIEETKIQYTTVPQVILPKICYQIIQKDITYFKNINKITNQIWCDTETCCVLTNIQTQNGCITANCIPKQTIQEANK